MAEITAAMVKELREKTGAGMMDCKKALAEANGDMEEATKILRKKGLAAAAKKAGRVTSEGTVYAGVIDKKGIILEMNSETDFVAQNAEFRELVDGVAKVIARSKATTVDDLVDEKFPGDAEGHNVAQVISSKIAKIGENISLRRFERIEPDAKTVFGSYIHAGGKIGVLVEAKADDKAKSAAEQLARDVAMHIAAAEPRFLKREEVTDADLATEREIARDQALKSGKPENVVDKIVSGKMEKFYGETVLMEQPYIRDDKMSVRELVASKAKEAGGAIEISRYVRYKLGEGLEKREDDFGSEVMAIARG